MKRPTKLGTLQHHLVEVSPFVHQGRLLIFESVRPRTPDNTRQGNHYLRIRHLHDGTRDARDAGEFAASPVLCEFGEGFTFGVPFVWEDETYVYATLSDKKGLQQDDVHLFHSRDMTTWSQRVAVAGDAELLFNCSVCRADGRFIMAYETNDPTWPAFTIKFAQSTDLITWQKLPVEGAIYGKDRYTACPTIRWIDGGLYMWYLERPTQDWWFETYLTRSVNLKDWQDAPTNPILSPTPDENINNSDIDFAQFGGQVIIYYSWGSQKGEEHLAHAVYDGTVAQWAKACYP